MIENDNYYRRRIEEELAAAARSEDPSISHIHLEMARRYREMLSAEADRANGASSVAQQTTAQLSSRGPTSFDREELPHVPRSSPLREAAAPRPQDRS